MKIIIYLAFIFSISGCNDFSYVSNDTESGEAIATALDIKNGIAYLPGENEPFTGKFEMYNSNDVGSDASMHLTYMIETDKYTEYNQFERRKGISKFTKWWFTITNHQKFVEINYKNGKKNGLSTSWYEDGQKFDEINFKDGKKNGLKIVWHTNGQKGTETNYTDDKQNGLDTHWSDAGEILYTVNYIDGQLDKSFHANKSKQKTSDPMQELIRRCRTQMGEYGAAMVKACVDQDIEAENALRKY